MSKKNLMKARNSFLGRVLRRLLGEEKGAVMMEYIVIALLIAAVAVVAIGYFGTSATQLCGALTHAISGQPSAAREAIKSAKTTADTGATQSVEHRSEVQKNEGSGDTTDTTNEAGW